MSSTRSNFQEDTHYRVLRLLQLNPEMSQRELADAVRVSVGGMHYALHALVEKVSLSWVNSPRRKTRVAMPTL